MQNYFRLFPLNWVVFPGEVFKLHIFEPRYKQLVNECLANKELFGIPFFDQKLTKFGTLVEIKETKKVYAEGEMDLVVEGKSCFEILKFDAQAAGKLYPGGKIKTLETTYHFDTEEALNLLKQIHLFFTLLGSRPSIEDTPFETLSFRFGHKLGLPMEQEIQLALLEDESERQEFLLRYLEMAIPGMSNSELARTRIKMNGHFKTFDALRF